jgi:hypothetical protein
MNEEDLRKCAALMKVITGASAYECFKFADEFIEASKQKEKDDEENVGIASVAKRSYRRKS